MKTKITYPLPLSYISDRHDEAVSFFQKKRPHKETFIDLAVLEGSFLCENDREIFETLEIGERLYIKQQQGSKHHLPPLTVFREKGDELGKLPFAQSILPNILTERGISVWCYAEAKSYVSDILEIAVSVYCDSY